MSLCNLFPGLHLVRATLGELQVAIRFAHRVEINIDVGTDFNGDLPFFVEEFVSWNGAFGLVADVNGDPVSLDGDYLAGNYGLFLDAFLIKVGVKKGCELVAIEIGDIGVDIGHLNLGRKPR